MHVKRLIMLVWAGLGIMATFLPWSFVPGTVVRGHQGWLGWACLLLFAAAQWLALRGTRSVPPGPRAGALAGWAFVAAGALGLYVIADFHLSGGGQAFGMQIASLAAGPWIVLGCAVLGAVTAFARRRTAAVTA